MLKNKLYNKKRFSPVTAAFVFITLIISNGCYLEKKIGKEFVNNADSISLLILEPDLVLKSNIKIDKSDSLNKTDLLKSLDGTPIAEIFMSELKKQLLSYGMKVYTSSRIDTFFTLPPPAFLFNIAQLEVEAYDYPFKDKLVTDSLIYTQEFLLNAFNFNTWFEFSELNSERKPEVLFSNFYINDNITGNFKVNLISDDVTYVYDRKDLAPDDLLYLIKYAGKTNADYIFNYLLNNYVNEKLKGKTNDKYFYYYKPDKKKIIFLENYVEFRKINK